MISSQSRYSDSKVVTLNKGSIAVQVIVPGSAETYTFNYVFHVLTGQDRVDALAQAFYNDPTQWWRIGDANPEILDWSSLTAGMKIRIPNA